jgi:LPXTG-motif cell wall-anchored protein
MFHEVEKYLAIALLVLMGVVVISGAVEVAYEVVSSMIDPPGFFVGVAELLDIFGLFLMVLIGLELMTSIKMYLDDHRIHAEMMFLVALTAVTRKIVIMDLSNTDSLTVLGIGFLVLSLSGGYYLLKKKRPGSGVG